MPKLSHSMLKSKHLEHSSEEEEIELFSYIDLLNYMLKYKIPQIVTLTQCFDMLIFAMHQKQKIPVKY